MSRWSSLLGLSDRSASSRTPAPAPEPQLTIPKRGQPLKIALRPDQDEEVVVWFHAHTIDKVAGAFLTGVTDGLFAAHGQREIVITLKRTDDDADALSKMHEMIMLFKQIDQFARAGRLVSAGGITQFGERGPFGTSHSSLVYVSAVDAASLRGIDDLPSSDALMAILLIDGAESAAARIGGPARVLARLGEQAHMYPLPYWSDVTRPSVGDAAREESGILSRVPSAAVAGISFVADSVTNCLRIQVPSRVTKSLRELIESIPSDCSAFALLLTSPASAANAKANANAHLVWRPGQTEPTAITPPGADGTRMTGSFLLFAPGVAEGDDEVQLVEDGYSLLMSVASWAQVRSALVNATPLSLSIPGSLSLEIEFT